MKRELKNFLHSEREISFYKISMLENGKERIYKNRLIQMEKEFIKFPFENLNIASLDELKDAISLFRLDKISFDKKYSNSSQEKSEEFLLEKIEQKIDFYNRIFQNLLEDKINNPKILNLLANGSISAESNLDKSAKFEGNRIAKKRARLQILIYCISRCIHATIKQVKMLLEKQNSIKELEEINLFLDNNLDSILDNMFKYYNDAIKEVPEITKTTPGHNNMIYTVYPLINAIDKYNLIPSIKRNLEMETKILNEDNTFLDKKYAKRAFSILTNIDRVGNEWINILYLDLISSNGINLSRIFEKEFFNFKDKNGYIKAIATIPIWDIFSNNTPDKIRNYFVDKFLIADNELYPNLSCDSINKINNYSNNIEIDAATSSIIVPVTRTESFHIDDSLNMANLLINQIKNDYKIKFSL